MRTVETLVQKIDAELIWRRREMHDFRDAVQVAASVPRRREALLRGGVPLLYAHWEGFVKRCGSYYLQYVANQRMRASELQANFVAITLKSRLSEASKSNKTSTSVELVEFFCTRLGERLWIPHKGVIETESNLSSKVFREIVWTLGLDMSPFETKCVFIDRRLLERRNHIAHGDSVDIDLDAYLEMHDEVIQLMELFRSQLQNAATTKRFKR